MLGKPDACLSTLKESFLTKFIFRAVFSDPGIVPLPQHRIDFSDAHSNNELEPPQEDWTICTRYVDPLGQPTITAGNDHCFHTCPSPYFKNRAKRSKFQVKAVIATGGIVGLAQGIIVLLLLFYEVYETRFYSGVKCTVHPVPTTAEFASAAFARWITIVLGKWKYECLNTSLCCNLMNLLAGLTIAWENSTRSTSYSFSFMWECYPPIPSFWCFCHGTCPVLTVPRTCTSSKLAYFTQSYWSWRVSYLACLS